MTRKKKIALIVFFANGNLAVYDEQRCQIAKLQKNPIVEVIRKARKMGYNVDDAKIMLPCGEAKVLKKFDNYQMIE